ncbi:MAG: VOC family protein [Steroidobacteraceae bacterium]
MIQKIAFTVYPVVNADVARAFYEKTLGLKRGSHSSNGVWTEYDLPGGGCLALFGDKNAKPAEGRGGSVALEVADLDAQISELKGKGVKFTNDMIHSPVCRMATFRDPDGNEIILHELKKKS